MPRPGRDAVALVDTVLCRHQEGGRHFIDALLSRQTERHIRNEALSLRTDLHLARWENGAALDSTVAALAEMAFEFHGIRAGWMCCSG